jgi:hypothetical protein
MRNRWFKRIKLPGFMYGLLKKGFPGFAGGIFGRERARQTGSRSWFIPLP